MSDPTLRLSAEKQRELARERMQQMIADDPSAFVESLGHDKDELLVAIMRELQLRHTRTGIYAIEDMRDSFAIGAINALIDNYVTRYIEARIE